MSEASSSEQVSERFEQVSERFEQIRERFGRMSERFGHMSKQMSEYPSSDIPFSRHPESLSYG